jgi:hypothetical protein
MVTELVELQIQAAEQEEAVLLLEMVKLAVRVLLLFAIPTHLTTLLRQQVHQHSPQRADTKFTNGLDQDR